MRLLPGFIINFADLVNNMKKETYKIIGMHCASCVNAIEQALLKTKGVSSASVNFASESALIEFDQSIISESELVELVKSIGYQLIIEKKEESSLIVDNGNKTEIIKIIGMDSPHCAMVVQSALKKLSGIENIDVNFSNKQAKIVYNPLIVTVDQIFEVITNAGYKPIKQGKQTEKSLLKREKTEQQTQLRALKLKLVIGGVLTVAIFLGSFSEWLSFVPGFLSSKWTLLILASIVQFWVGWQFYSGLKLLVKYRTADMNTLIAIGTLAAYFYSAVVIIFPSFFSKQGIVPAIYF